MGGTVYSVIFTRQNMNGGSSFPFESEQTCYSRQMAGKEFVII